MKVTRKGTNTRIAAKLAEHAKLAAEFELAGFSRHEASTKALRVLHERRMADELAEAIREKHRMEGDGAPRRWR